MAAAADWLSEVWNRALDVGEDIARKATGVLSTDAEAPSAQNTTPSKGADTVSRANQEAMPRWLWLVLAALVGLIVVVAVRRR